MTQAATEVQTAREAAAQLGASIREDEDKLRKKRAEQQKKWADHGYELTQQYTIKAAQNNMRSLKAQNAGIVNGMHAKREDNKQVRMPRRRGSEEQRRLPGADCHAQARARARPLATDSPQRGVTLHSTCESVLSPFSRPTCPLSAYSDASDPLPAPLFFSLAPLYRSRVAACRGAG